MKLMLEGNVFVDTNVLLYASDASDPQKRTAAHEWLSSLWETGAGRLSWQVLHEFYVNAVRRTRVPTPQARELVGLYTRWRPGSMGMALMERAWYWTDSAQLSYWDGLILASAEHQGCPWLLSEDFQSGRKYGMVTIVNPFDGATSKAGLRK